MSEPGDSPGAAATAAEGGPDGGEPPQSAAVPDLLLLEVVADDGDWSWLGDAESAMPPIARAIARHERLSRPAVAAVALSSDARLATLNGVYRGKPKSTNVLSFPAPRSRAPVFEADVSGGAPRQLGDVVLALETVLAEARERDIPPLHHVQHLIVHGVLHLCGRDHETEAEAEAMEALETAILADLGVANPYLDPQQQEEPVSGTAG